MGFKGPKGLRVEGRLWWYFGASSFRTWDDSAKAGPANISKSGAKKGGKWSVTASTTTTSTEKPGWRHVRFRPHGVESDSRD